MGQWGLHEGARGSKERKGRESREEDNMDVCSCVQEGGVWVHD